MYQSVCLCILCTKFAYPNIKISLQLPLVHLPLVPFFSAKITSLYLPAQKKSLLVEGKKKNPHAAESDKIITTTHSTAILNILINVDSSKIIVYSGFRCSAPEKLGNERGGQKIINKCLVLVVITK